jgi:hypothetical protein
MHGYQRLPFPSFVQIAIGDAHRMTIFLAATPASTMACNHRAETSSGRQFDSQTRAKGTANNKMFIQLPSNRCLELSSGENFIWEELA